MCHVTHNEHKKPCKHSHTHTLSHIHTHTHAGTHTQRQADRKCGTCYASFFSPFFIFMSRRLALSPFPSLSFCVCVFLYVRLCLLTSLTNCQITRNSIKNLNFVRASSKAPESRQRKYAQARCKWRPLLVLLLSLLLLLCSTNKSLCKVLVNNARNEAIIHTRLKGTFIYI